MTPPTAAPACGQATGLTLPSGALQLTISNCTDPGPTTCLVRCIVRNNCNFDGEISQPATVTHCPADFNCDGFLDFFDFTAFLDAFESGDLAADFSSDGFLDFFDAAVFVTVFESGC